MEALEAVPVTDPLALRDEGLCKGHCDGWRQCGAGQNGGTRSSDLHVYKNSLPNFRPPRSFS